MAGLLIGFAGPAVCFGFLSIAYLAPIAVLLTVIPDVAPLPRAAGTTALGELVAGLRVAAADPLVRGVVIVASVLAFCGVSYMPFLPVLARTQLHVGPEALGIMYSVGGIGGLVGGLAIASMGRGAGRLQLMLVGGIVYAASLFAVAHGTVLADHAPCAGRHQLRVRGGEHVDDHAAADGYRPGAARAGCSVSTRPSSRDCSRSAPSSTD